MKPPSQASQPSKLSCEFELLKAAAGQTRIKWAGQQAIQVNHQSEVKQSEQAEQVKKPSSYSARKPANQPTNQPTTNKLTNQSTDQPIKQLTNQPTSRPPNHGADLANYSQNKRLRPPLLRKVLVREGRKEGITFRSFKLAENRICESWDSQISQTVYLSLQLQNHMGFRFGSSWGVVEQISKSHW